jgi:hypothetical protein
MNHACPHPLAFHRRIPQLPAQALLKLRRRAQGALPTTAVAASWCLALFVASWSGAGWFWELTAPSPAALVVVPSAEPLDAAQAVASRHLMGTGGPVSAGEGRASAIGGYRLLGAVTGHGGTPGFAILAEGGGRSLAAVEGEEFAPGVVLARVMPRAVELRRQGHAERLAIPEQPLPGPKP